MDCQPFWPNPGVQQEILRSDALNRRPRQCEESWKPISGLSESPLFINTNSTVRNPVLLDVQATHLDSMLFCVGIAEQCKRHEKVLRFLMSGSSEVDRCGLDVSLLSDLMGLQSLTINMDQQLFTSSDYGPCYYRPEAETSRIFLPNEFFAQKPLLDFIGDMPCSSNILVHSDGRVSFTGTGTEMKDLFSIVAEFYLSKNPMKWEKRSLLVPHFRRLDTTEAQANIHGFSLSLETVTVAPLKSPKKIKLKPSPKKNSRKVGKERDLYRKNYFHACESLLSLMMDRRKDGKAAYISLKKCGPELPHLLTQFSAGIAGTGLAVIFSVIYKAACGRVPFCASKLLNTGFGLGLFWLSGAVNRLRDTIVCASKSSGKLTLKEEEMMKRVDRSMSEIFFRVATLMAVAVLRLA